GCRQERIGLKRIEGPVVDREREITHRTDGDRLRPAGLEDAHAPLHLTDAENGDLRLVDDDGGSQQATAGAVIGDREGSAADVFGRELAVARGGDEPAEPS